MLRTGTMSSTSAGSVTGPLSRVTCGSWSSSYMGSLAWSGPSGLSGAAPQTVQGPASRRARRASPQRCAKARGELRVADVLSRYRPLRAARRSAPIERFVRAQLVLEHGEIGLRRVATGARARARRAGAARPGRAVQSRIANRAALAAATWRNSSRSLRRRNAASTSAFWPLRSSRSATSASAAYVRSRRRCRVEPAAHAPSPCAPRLRGRAAACARGRSARAAPAGGHELVGDRSLAAAGEAVRDDEQRLARAPSARAPWRGSGRASCPSDRRLRLLDRGDLGADKRAVHEIEAQHVDAVVVAAGLEIAVQELVGEVRAAVRAQSPSRGTRPR